MAAELSLIVDMVAVLGTAAVGGYLTTRLGQPALLGYLLAGLAVGPSGLEIVKAEGAINFFAEMGVVLLLFALGVEFSFSNLLKVRKIALGGGTLQVLLTTLLGGGLAYFTHWVDTLPQAIFLGAVLSLSSTAVVLKSLIERNEMQTMHGQVMLGILIIQDLSLGLMLAVLPILTQPAATIGQALLVAVLKTALFFLLAVVAGLKIVPTLMKKVAQTGSQELFVLSVVALCMGVALATASMGLGIEMGAFVAGLMVSQVEYADHALQSILPMRDVFATLFFASIGMLIDPVFLVENLGTLLSLVAIVMVGKALIVTTLVVIFGYGFSTALKVGLGINQIGEFSFVLAGVAVDLDLFSPRLYGLMVGTTAITLLITPFVFKLSTRLPNYLERIPGIGRWFIYTQRPKEVAIPDGLAGHCVVAGYGRVGQTLVRMLRSQEHPVLVIENNEATLQTLRDQKIPYLFGDASSELVLRKSKLDRARVLAIALPDPLATRLTLKRALSMVPGLDVTVRAHAIQEIDVLYQLGAKEVVQPEFEASLEMGAHVLLNLGDPIQQVQTIANTYRAGHYREIVPKQLGDRVPPELGKVVEGLEGRWYTLKPNSPFINQTISQTQIRSRTGATIMAVRRGQRIFRYPHAFTLLEAGDRLLLVGSPHERRAFENLLSQAIP
ncbi:cation:proton antiporter domain-containing protein [Acaryochloris marina NIES-2412]|uniref:cation:proton antiporter domain-containing protein n=1 Tax=Acaryochloris marina TaxID=155978 RepID=UPI0040589C65